MKNPLALLALLVVVVGGAVVYFYWRNTHAPQPAPPPPAVATPPAVAPPVAEAPRIEHPLPEAPASPTPLPPLGESDLLAKDTVVGMFGPDTVSRFFVPDGLVRRFVVTIDNLPRRTVAARLMPVKPVPGAFLVEGSGDALAIGEQNALRYRPYVLAMEQVEARKLVAAYVRLYPLFQSAYEELGYPNRYFNDRLVQAIDDLLAAPDVAAPRLVQPKVLYEFADPALEDRSAGQKMMIRMGPANAARVKDKLRAIRRELTGQMSAAQNKQ